MSLPAKIFTALRLLGAGDWPAFRRQWRAHFTARRLRHARGQPFAYHDFGYPMVCHPDWPDSVRILAGDDVDEWECRLLRHWLRPGDTAFDFGANLGAYTFAAAAAVGPRGRVISVDADAFVIQKLAAGALLLGTPQVRPVHRAITLENGTVTFYIRADHTHTGGQSLRPEEADRQASTAVTVPAGTVPHLLESVAFAGMPALVKVDIEGAEGLLLATVPPAWFGADGPLWIMEVNPRALGSFNQTARAVASHFPPEHFECWLLSKHPVDPAQLPRVTALDGATDFTDAHYYNLFAIPRGASHRGRCSRLAGFFPASTLAASVS